MYLDDKIQKILRDMKKILVNEVALKEGDLFIAVNVETQARRILNVDTSLIESFFTKSGKKDGKRILRD